MPEYINNNSFTVYLPGPDGKIEIIKSKQKKMLPEYFEKYVIRGFINRHLIQNRKVELKKTPKIIHAKPTIIKKLAPNDSKKPHINRRTMVLGRQVNKPRQVISPVGRAYGDDSAELIKSIESSNYPISNNIGVGILSYNRVESLEKCVNSIIKHTDLNRTTIFISDDNSSDVETIKYLSSLQENKSIVVIRNNERLGVAGNSNRLLRCLSRFKYGLLLNDDVEIKSKDWEYFYPQMIERTKYHHFVYRESGVYGATIGAKVIVNNVSLYRIEEKPHGAVLAFSHEYLSKVGYFDERYGLYGMEHVDWSNKAHDFGIQPAGYYDVEGSNKYFKINAVKSSIVDKSDHLSKAKKLYNNREIKRCEPSNKVNVPSITYIIPFYNLGRCDSLKSVINNIRGQKYPNIEIIIVEQKSCNGCNLNTLSPVNHYLYEERQKFNKSRAFNLGVLKSGNERLILHDADMLVVNDYTSKLANILNDYESAHIGKTVVYADPKSTSAINVSESVRNTTSERVVGYYEGGSLGITKEAYWKCGGFNEDFEGYGCEDCDFYDRINNCKFISDRTENLLHLWHDRVDGWAKHHEVNRYILDELRKMTVDQRIRKQLAQMVKLNYVKL